MNKNHRFLKSTLATTLVLFPCILILAFIMHFHSLTAFFEFKWKKSASYDSSRLFDDLIKPEGGRFIHAHAIAYLSIPFMIITILCLGYLLYFKRPVCAMVGVVIGIIGSIFMAGVFASWLSFTAVARVDPQYYTGAKAALAELTRMTGVLKVITWLSFLSLMGIIILSIGFLTTSLLPKWSPIFLILGCIIIGVFMDLDNWMLIGSFFLFMGILPVSHLLRKGTD